MDTALPQKFPFILDRNLAKANCTGNRVCTSCDTVVLGRNIKVFASAFFLLWIAIVLLEILDSLHRALQDIIITTVVVKNGYFFVCDKWIFFVQMR